MAATLKRKTNVVKLKHIKRDRGYRWTDSDPVLEEISVIITKTGWSTYELAQKVREVSKGLCTIAPKTIDYWQNGKTRRPQNFLVDWVAHACGYHRKFTKI